jgi:glucose/arabinose dehydrogenase
VPVSVIDVAGASLQPGFSMLKYADIFRPTGLATYREGGILATSQDGTIHLFVDEDNDGRADVDSVFGFGFLIPLGVTLGPDSETVYVSSNGRISTLIDTDGDMVADKIDNFVQGLPVGLHQNDNLKFGPDGMIYIGVGSTCNVCIESDQRSATLMRFDPATGTGEVYATGLRNPYDLTFHPITGDLFATDNGRDDLGMDVPQEELNLIRQGADYGWPNCWDDGVGTGCDGTEVAVAFFEPHGSANSIDFYTRDRFPPEYGSNVDRATAYVTVLGSWIKPEVETGIARVWLWPEGESYRSEVSWFAQWPGGMPLGLIAGTDGALYVGDYINDAIYRISYGP